LQRNLQSNLSRHFKDDELARTALQVFLFVARAASFVVLIISLVQSSWTTGVITLASGTKKKGESGYWRTAIVDGSLSIVMYEMSNLSYIGDNLKVRFCFFFICYYCAFIGQSPKGALFSFVYTLFFVVLTWIQRVRRFPLTHVYLFVV